MVFRKKTGSGSKQNGTPKAGNIPAFVVQSTFRSIPTGYSLLLAVSRMKLRMGSTAKENKQTELSFELCYALFYSACFLICRLLIFPSQISF